jgi:alpha-galactosidase
VNGARRRSLQAAATLGVWGLPVAGFATGAPGSAASGFKAQSKRINAAQLANDGFPTAAQWAAAPALAFAHDWRGQPIPGPQSTQVHLLNTAQTLFLRFVNRYAQLHTFEQAGSADAIYPLWERDVVEVFLQAPGAPQTRYREVEVAPNGLLLELQIDGPRKTRVLGASRARTSLEPATKIWTAEVAISLRESMPPGAAQTALPWRANFFRVEGLGEARLYSSWSPTRTPTPDFHVPQAFGSLLLDLSAPDAGRVNAASEAAPGRP